MKTGPFEQIILVWSIWRVSTQTYTGLTLHVMKPIVCMAAMVANRMQRAFPMIGKTWPGSMVVITVRMVRPGHISVTLS